MSIEIRQTWTADMIILSYIISVTGSFCTIQIMEQWRFEHNARRKSMLLIAAACILGGCGIWSMHFTGMNALDLGLKGRSSFDIDYEGFLTILSFIFAVCGVLVGLLQASRDPFFLELEREKRAQLLTNHLKKMNMTQLMKKGSVERSIKLTAMFSRLWRIGFGGAWTAFGVLGMHYAGMLAQRTYALMSVSAPLVVLSCIVALVTANAAFWIIFRLLPLWPHHESLRLISALIMGIAVCGTHYSGMAAASYTYSSTNMAERTFFLIQGNVASEVASHGSLLICFWVSGILVIRPLRVTASKYHVLNPNTTTANSEGAGSNATQRSQNLSMRENQSMESRGPQVTSANQAPLSPSAAALSACKSKKKGATHNMNRIMPNQP